MRTFHAKREDTQRDWVVVDAADQVLGRLSTRIATLLRGKHRPDYTPHCDVGDFVVVINAEKIRLTGGKESKKSYFRHTGYPGGQKHTVFSEMQAKHPERVIEKAVWGMLPRTRLGRKQIRKLKVYAGPDHPHEAQQPQTVNLQD